MTNSTQGKNNADVNCNKTQKTVVNFPKHDNNGYLLEHETMHAMAACMHRHWEKPLKVTVTENITLPKTTFCDFHDNTKQQ